MDAAASEISNWKVLSTASGCGGDAAAADNSEVVVVSGGGGDVLHVHEKARFLKLPLRAV